MEPGPARVGPPAAHLVEAEVDGEISIYNTATGLVHVLNGTASDAWRLSDGDHSAQQIVTLLARAYGIDAEEIRLEVVETLRSFEKNGLLRQ